jgi:restriction endonuclease S subunit
MKDSGIEWIGEVPEEWGIKPIKHIFGAIGSGTTPDSSKVEYYDGNINWLQSGDLYKKDYVYAVSKTITDLGYRSSASLRIYQAPFLAIAMYGASIGNLAISKIDACVNQAVAVLKGEENIVRFAKLALEISKTELIFAAQGGTQPNINQVLIKNWVIPFPSEIEIKKIADFLDKKVAQLDKVKSLLEEQIKTLEDYRQSLIYETVTKGLDKNAPLKEVANQWIGVIPSDWEERKLRYLAQTRNEKIVTKNSDSYVGLENITPKTGLYIETESEVDLTENISFKQGDILFGKLRPYLRKFWKAEFDGTASSEFIVFKESILELEFLYWAIQSDSFVNDVNSSTYGSKMPRASWEYIKEIKIPFPVSQNEQKFIVKFLNEKVVQINQMIAIKKEQIKNINKQRQTLIYDVVTGKRRV